MMMNKQMSTPFLFFVLYHVNISRKFSMGFLGVNFWSRVFIGVMLKALGMFSGN